MAFGRLGGSFGRAGLWAGAGGVSAAAGGAALLVGEANGFAADFTYATDASRVAVKTAGTVVSSGTSFFTSAGTSSKWIYNVAGTLVNVAAGTLPLDYDPVTHAAKGLLVEPAGTNSCLRSAEFDNASWGKNALTITANAIAAPDGTTSADACIPPAGNTAPYINQPPVVTSGTVVTFSVYIKYGTLGTPWFLMQSDTSAWFNLATGVKGTTTGSPISSNMIAVGSGWYRCDMTFTAASGAPQVYLAVAPSDGGAANCLIGDGVKPAFYLWGAQMEALAVATSYIPTTTASVTRAADNYSFLLSAIPAISTAFTLYGRWQTPSIASNRFAYCVTDNLGTPGDYAGLFASTSARLTVADGTATQATIVAGTIVANTPLSIAGRVAANDFSASMNGAAVVTDVSGTQPVVTHVRFGNTGGNAAATAQFWVEKMVILPRGMTNPELVTRGST